MGTTIGILHFETDSEQNNNFDKLIKTGLNEQGYSLIEIKEKKQIGLIDGLIIKVEKSSDYVQVFQWLIDLQDDYSLFIWIICGDEKSELVKLYPHLSKNSVIEIFKSDQNVETLAIVIKNAINYKHYLLNKIEEKKILEDHFLDPSKLSLVVRDKIITLTRKEFKIIELLYLNMGKVVTYHEINHVIYGDLMEDPIAKYRVANFIFHIRSKLKNQNYFEIEIVRTKGYVLTYSKFESNFSIQTNEKVLLR